MGASQIYRYFGMRSMGLEKFEHRTMCLWQGRTRVRKRNGRSKRKMAWVVSMNPATRRLRLPKPAGCQSLIQKAPIRQLARMVTHKITSDINCIDNFYYILKKICMKKSLVFTATILLQSKQL